ncbi:MAG: sensor histidine kinase [Thermodesulfobacteriota bacterium]
MVEISLNRTWQERIVTLLILISVAIGGLGIYTLHTSPTLSLDSGPPLPITEYEIQRIEDIELSPTFFNRLPEFFTLKQETGWWQMQKKVYKLLKKGSLMVEFTDRNRATRKVETTVGFLSLSEVIKKTGLIYLVALIYILSALSVFKRYRSPASTILTFFLLFGSLYFISSAPVVNRTITLYPPYFRILINSIYISAGGLITLVHLAFVFPRPKEMLKRFPWIPYILYGFFLITTSLYLFRLIAFGATFPFLCLWTLIMIGAFIHSLLKEKDPFLKKQITLSLLAPLMVGSIFIFLYILPGILGMASMDFTYLALFSLILPYALPSAMDNLHLYHERLEMEKRSQREKERIGQELHDSISNDLTNIRYLIEVAEQSLSSEPEKVEGILKTIKETILRNIERLKDFLWVIDPEEEGLDDLISHFKSYTAKHFDLYDIDIKFKTSPSSKAPYLNTSHRFNIFNIYKETMTNIIKHSKAKRVEVGLSFTNRGFEMKINDNGVGFDPKVNPKGCYGLRSIRKRAEEIGGALNITSEEGKGTEIYLILPQKYPI